MPGIVIVAHTPLASAMLGFAEQTFGMLPEKIQAVDIPPHEDAKVSLERLLVAAQAVDMGNGILVLTDVMGATPANVASRLISQLHLAGKSPSPVIVLTGLNLPMLMRAVSYRQDDLDELARKTLQGGQNGILRIGANTNCHNTASEGF
ncbi:MAG: PTS fructose transporter subunit IIA [Burkholderiales bacterium]|jgi:PTS system ascorbate-specific IIA component|nr:PTS fructose transporter subunit IIA [Burkholderiales bacterium]